MDILYFGKYADNFILEEKINEKQPYFVAQYSYEKELVTNLMRDSSINIKIYSIYQTDYFPKKSLFINQNSKESSINYLRYINVPFLREISFFIETVFAVIFWYFKTEEGNRIIYASTHFPPNSLAIKLMGKILNINTIMTFTDLSLFTYSKDKVLKMPFYKRIVMKPYKKLVDFLQNSFDGYVLFTSKMNEIINKQGKPYVIVEGMYMTESREDLGDDSNKKVGDNSNSFTIAHAGTLNEEVGIKKILEAFSNIQSPEARLILMGNGDMVNIIKEYESRDSRIKFLGFLPREDVFQHLKNSDLLINLRDNNQIYTKYSFPSKMFEYMASGTPVITTKLDGIPDEYYNYTFAIDSYDSEEIANFIVEIMKNDSNYLKATGEEAKKFIEEYKSGKAQTFKIKRFLNGFF